MVQTSASDEKEKKAKIQELKKQLSQATGDAEETKIEDDVSKKIKESKIITAKKPQPKFGDSSAEFKAVLKKA